MIWNECSDVDDAFKLKKRTSYKMGDCVYVRWKDGVVFIVTIVSKTGKRYNVVEHDCGKDRTRHDTYDKENFDTWFAPPNDEESLDAVVVIRAPRNKR
jgi:hypothetical protein